MDIDIDLRPDFRLEETFPAWRRASVFKNGIITPHPCGAYPQGMMGDPITGLSAIPYSEAEELGYLKVDFLHLNVYKHFSTHDEIDQLLKIEPNWNLLLVPSVVEKLFQLGKHADILAKVKPTSLDELADILALIRPGKRSLLEGYLANREVGRRLLYAKSKGEYSFKRSHAFAYAMVIVLQLHLVEAGMPLESL
jgi:DNA polymerase III alpha subunit